MYLFKFFSVTTGATEARFYAEPPCDSNDLGHLLFFILILSAYGGGGGGGGAGLLAGILPQISPRSAFILAGL